jgi:uncharacterized protein YegL
MKQLKTIEERIVAIKKMNKVARENYANKYGFKTSKDYIADLESRIGLSKSQSVKTLNKNPAPIPKEKPLLAVTIHVIDLLDCSGSMGIGYGNTKIVSALVAINEGVKKLAEDKSMARFTHSFITFSGKRSTKINHIVSNPHTVAKAELTASALGGTALNDSIVTALMAIEEHRKVGEKVLLNIYTDGEENDSVYYTPQEVSGLIEDYQEKGFTITFIGTIRDTQKAIKDFGIPLSNTLAYDGTAAGLKKSMKISNNMRAVYADSASRGMDVSKGFFKTIN